MKKVLIAVVLLLSTAIADNPHISNPSDNTYTNQNSVSISWTYTGSDAKCYGIFKSFNDGGFGSLPVDSGGTDTTKSYTFQNGAGKYSLKIGRSTIICSDATWSPSTTTYSDPINIHYDITSPTATSPSDGGSVLTSSDIDIQFNEDMAASPAPTITMNPGVANTTSWTNTKLYSFHPTATLTKGQSYTMSVSGAKDLAGNTMNSKTISFVVDPDLIGLTITAPAASSTIDQGSTISITASTTGSNGAIISDAVVSASGACSASLTHSGNGVYSGTCQVNTVGLNTLTVTATRGSVTKTASVTFTVQKAYGLNMTILAPTNSQYKRGETVNFSVKVTQPDQQAVTGKGLTISVNGKNVLASYDSAADTFSASYTTSISEQSPLAISLTGSGSIAGKQATVTRALSIALASATINPNVQLSPIRDLHNPGEIVRLSIDPKYADGTRFQNPTLAGTLQGQIVTFQKQADGSYISNQTYTILAIDSVVTTHVSISDQSGNSKNVDTDFDVAGGVFTINVEKPQIREISSGQSVSIQVKVLKEGIAVSDASVNIMDGGIPRTMTSAGNGVYTASYNNVHTDDFSLRIQVSQGGQQTSKLLSFVLNNKLVAEVPTEVAGQLVITIRYPNGDPVAAGTFTADADGSKTTLISQKNGTFVGDLKVGEGTHTLSLSGSDTNNNPLSFTAPITVKQSPQQLAIYGIAAVLLLALAGGGYVIHQQSIAGPKRDYLALLEEMTGVREQSMKAEQDFYKRRVSEDQFRKLGLEYQQEADNYRRKMVDMEARNSKLKSYKYDFALQKASELASQGMSEAQISKILKDFDEPTVSKALENYKKQAVQQSKVDDAQLLESVKGQLRSGVSEEKIRSYLSDKFPKDVVDRIMEQAKK